MANSIGLGKDVTHSPVRLYVQPDKMGSEIGLVAVAVALRSRRAAPVVDRG
jgi:hypothetical protein